MAQVAGSGTAPADNVVVIDTALPSALRYSTPSNESGTSDTVAMSIEALGSENRIYPSAGGLRNAAKVLPLSGEPSVLVTVRAGANRRDFLRAELKGVVTD
jgi:hypothetical protein